MASSRERVLAAVNHQQPDRVPIDLGGSPTSGIAASAVFALRKVLDLPNAGEPVRVVEPYQVLGEVDDALRQAVGIDTVWLAGRTTMFGFENTGWKPWQLFDGTPVLVPEAFNTIPEPDGSILMYPQGDRSAGPCAKMPAGGFYFDSIPRQKPIDEDNLNVEDNLQEFGRLGDADLRHLERESRRLRDRTDAAVVAGGPGTAFGDIALVPGPMLKDPRGIRDVAEWYMSLAARTDYVREVFARQCEIALENLELMRQAVGDRVDVVFMSGTDYGTQRGPLCSPDAYRDLSKPFQKRLNDWVHEHTSWKTFIHTCGGIEPLLDDIIDAGFDILNPVQCSADGMAPERLKRTYGDRITFWGGGIDTQKTLPFGTPDEVADEVRDRLRIFGPGGGFVFNAVHNIQANTPPENLRAMVETLREAR